jgi:hypothetical protein
MITKQRIEKCIEDLKKEKLVQKYLYSYTWLSGSSTNVYPIKVWKESIVLQWSSDKAIFDKFIQRVVEKNSDIFSRGIFWKSDGSCPSRITFYFKDEIEL